LNFPEINSAPIWTRCHKNLNVDSFLIDLDDKLRCNLSNNSDADSKFALFLDSFIDETKSLAL